MPAERVPLELHLDPLSPEERGIWDRYVGLVEAAGASEMIVNKSRIAFRAPHRIFTGGFFKSHRFELFFDLPDPLPESERDHRFRAVWEHSRTAWVHRLKIERAEELDDRLAAWLLASWAAYSKPPPSDNPCPWPRLLRQRGRHSRDKDTPTCRRRQSSSMGWRRGEEWFDADVLWFGEGAGAPAVAGFALPPLPRFGAVGLAASQQRREAWRRRRRARATALILLPAAMVPPALFRSGGAPARVLAEDPPSLTFRVDTQTGQNVRSRPAVSKPNRSRKADASPTIEWRNATSLGLHWSGSLVDGTQLPVEGPNWVTWNPITDSVPNAPSRLYGNERMIRTLVSVIDAYRAANPRAPRVVVGDISFEGGGRMDAHLSHQNGLDVDIYYPRLDRGLREARLPDAIDRRLAQDLLDRFVAAGATMVFVGYYTDLRGPAESRHPLPEPREPHARPLPGTRRLAHGYPGTQLAHGRCSQYGGRSRRPRSTPTYACFGSDVSSGALAP